VHYWPGDPVPRITRLEDHERGDPWTTTQLAFCAHIGTHVDAPLHRVRGGGTVDALDLHTLVGPAFVADLTDVASEISAQEMERRNVPAGVKRLLFKTRNGELWQRPEFQQDFVALNGDGARWVVEHGIQLVGMDYLSADVFLTDTVLLESKVIIVEGMVLSAIEQGWYTLICLPIRLQGADGAPARAVLVSGTLEGEEER
jgi:arylformamidase